MKRIVKVTKSIAMMVVAGTVLLAVTIALTWVIGPAIGANIATRSIKRCMFRRLSRINKRFAGGYS